MPGNTNHNPSSWTPEKIATLIKLHSLGKPTSYIGREIGMSRNAVIGKCYRLRKEGGLPPSLNPSKSPPKPRSSFFGWKKLDAKPKPQAKPKPIAYAAPDSETATHLIDIKSNQCKFISADFHHGDGALQYMCGAAVYKPDASYCGYHHKICIYVELPNQQKKRGRDLERSLRRYT